MSAFSISSFLDSSKGAHSAVALMALAVSVGVLLVLVGRPELLMYYYPLSAFGVGIWLYAVAPKMYIGFTLWIWFLTPFMRRLVDYEAGMFNPTNPVMLAPLLVTVVSGVSLFRYGSRFQSRSFFPFVLLLCGIGHGYVVGAVTVGIQSATFAALSWILPLFFGLHIAFLWRQYPALTSILRTTVTWGLLVMGSYGLYQFFAGPPWDMMWLDESNMWLTMGRPEPMQFRVFSTLNSTGPYAFVVCAILLLLIQGRGGWTKLALIPGYITFLLTLVRSAWMGWIVGVTFLVFWRLQGRLRKRLLGVLIATILLGVPFFALSPASQNVAQRAQTFTNLEKDASFRARAGIYTRGAKQVLMTPLGYGLGSFGVAAKLSKGEVVSFDSGVFDVLFSLGWLGSLCYGVGIALLLRQTVFAPDLTDTFEPFLHAVLIAFLFMLLSINQFAGVMGMMFWTALGLALAARLHARRNRPDESPPVSTSSVPAFTS